VTVGIILKGDGGCVEVRNFETWSEIMEMKNFGYGGTSAYLHSTFALSSVVHDEVPGFSFST